MDKLLVPPLTLHQTIYLHFQVPLGLALPALPYITDLHTASNSHRPVWTASCPLMTAPNEHLHAFWQSASQAWKGFMVNKTTPFYYQLSNPSLQALFCSSDYRNTWLWLGSLWPRAGGGSTWQSFGVKRDVDLANSRRWWSSLPFQYPPPSLLKVATFTVVWLTRTLLKPLHSKWTRLVKTN